MNELVEKEIVIIGGGLAGLTTAALLSKEGKKVILLEKSVLGGRALTMSLKGFSFNFGAHAIYARDKSVINELEKKLSLNLEWKTFSKEKVKYDTGECLTEIPSNIKGLVKTKMLTGMNKIRFIWFVLFTMMGLNKYRDADTVKSWMDRNKIQPEIQKMILTLASSNFFTNEPENIEAEVFFNYYKRIFTTKRPVSYLKGGWVSLVNELKRIIKENGGEIITKVKITEIILEDNKISGVKGKDKEYRAKNFVFCIPPTELAKLFSETKHKEYFQTFASYKPANVIYYDIGLSKRIDTNLTYIYDVKEKMFITDISYYDENSAPEGGQLLQAITYLNEEEMKNPNYFEKTKGKIESFYDKHFEGWRDVLVVPRISKGATAQEIKAKKGQKLLPIKYKDVENVWFAGDWCEGVGQLSELSFSSAVSVAEQINTNQKRNG